MDPSHLVIQWLISLSASDIPGTVLIVGRPNPHPQWLSSPVGRKRHEKMNLRQKVILWLGAAKKETVKPIAVGLPRLDNNLKEIS